MSVAEAAHRPAKTGRGVGLWLAFILIIAAAIRRARKLERKRAEREGSR